MRRDSRLSRMLHVLVHMARHDGSATSEQIAAMLSANPVVVRRTMAGLREAGYVQSAKGHGGGWRLVRDLSEITVLDVYTALGQPTIFAIGVADDQPTCPIERAVNGALRDAYREAEALLIGKLAGITLADLARAYDRGRPGGRGDRLVCVEGAETGGEGVRGRPGRRVPDGVTEAG